jgi:hypothetical protein
LKWKRLFSFGKGIEKAVKLNKIIISEEAILLVKRYTNSSLQPFYKTDLNDSKKMEMAGVCLDVKQDEAEDLVLRMREELQVLGYLPFISDFDRKKVCISQVSDQFDILEIQLTNGENYDISNELVVSKLKDWHSRYPFTIIGADYDWVEVSLHVLPKDNELRAFAKEIFKFCPDIVEQGAGSLNGLIEEIKETQKLFLWWD